MTELGHKNDEGIPEIKYKKYLFSWDEIPGNDNILIEFLIQNFSIDWVKTAKIEKIDDDTTIRLSSENNYLLLKLNNGKTKVNLEIDGVKTDEFTVKMENGKLNIYKRNWYKLTKETKCHLDPDIRKEVLDRKDGWTGCFGQVNGAQTHLKEVKKGDLFLFFGWFRKAEIEYGKLRFKEKAPDLHVIFGYLQIEKIEKVDSYFKAPDWMENHPHTSKERRKERKNTMYVASEKLSLNGLTSLPGAGVFDFNNERVLTNTELSKTSRSKWKLFPFSKNVQISHHVPESWKQDYFQSASIGQEFVINAKDEDYEKVVEWAKEKIQSTKDYCN